MSVKISSIIFSAKIDTSYLVIFFCYVLVSVFLHIVGENKFNITLKTNLAISINNVLIYIAFIHKFHI